MPNPSRNLDLVRGYGLGHAPLRGGFCPYGSTTAAGNPTIPYVTRNPVYGPQPRWGGMQSVVHDPNIVGAYDVTLDADWQDFELEPQVLTNLHWYVSTAFLPSATTGHGLTLFCVGAGASSLSSQTVPLRSVVYESASGSLSATVSSEQLQITPATGGSTNAAVAAYLNSNIGTLGVIASAGDTDLSPTGGGAVVYFSGGANGYNLARASCFVSSDTSGSGLNFVAINPGAEYNGIRIIYIYTGTSAPAVALNAADEAGPVNITITIATSTGSTTNAAIASACAASAVFNKLFEVYITGSSTDTNTSTSHNINPGTPLSGGGSTTVTTVGHIHPKALTENRDSLLDYPHFILGVLRGGDQVDLDARAQILLPSTTAGSGVVVSSQATTAAQASANILSAGGASHGLTWTMVQAGDIGNYSGVVYSNPYATAFIPSTTGGDGVSYQSQLVGTAGQGIQINQTAPTGTATTVNVQGMAIFITPKTGETNSGIVTAVTANPAAAALVTATATGGGDTVSASPQLAQLGGGYTLAAGTVQVTVQQNGLVVNGVQGYTVTVMFGSGATNTEVRTAATGNSAVKAIMTPTVISSSGSDTVVATGLTFLAGGTNPADLSIAYAAPLSTSIGSSAQNANAGTLTVTATTNFPSTGTLDITDNSGNVEQIAYTGTTSTTFTGCSGGTAGQVFAAGAVIQLDTPIAVQSGNACTVYLGYTAANNTNTAIAEAIIECQPGASPSLQATTIGTASDLTAQNPQNGPFFTKNLTCGNLVMFFIDARDDASGQAV